MDSVLSFINIKLNEKSFIKMSLAFSRNWDRLDLLVHEVLLLAIAHVLAFEEVKVVASEEVKFILHLPNL